MRWDKARLVPHLAQTKTETDVGVRVRVRRRGQAGTGPRSTAMPGVVLPRRELHVDHGVGQEVLVAVEREDAVLKAGHDTQLRGGELGGGPEAAAPAGAVAGGRCVEVVGELGSDDEGGEDDELRSDSVDVELLVVEGGGRSRREELGGHGVALGRR